MSSLTDPLGPDLKATLRALKLGKLTATLPERLTLARQTDMPHADFLQLVLSDEVARREAGSIVLRAKNAGLDPAMRTETWDPTAAASEWLPLMADPLLAQSAIDRLTSTCHELVVEGDSYRRRQRPAAPPVDEPAPATR